MRRGKKQTAPRGLRRANGDLKVGFACAHQGVLRLLKLTRLARGSKLAQRHLAFASRALQQLGMGMNGLPCFLPARFPGSAVCGCRLEAPISLPYQHLALLRCVFAPWQPLHLWHELLD